MSEPSTIDPCPFCGSKDVAPHKGEYGAQYVECMTCQAFGPSADTRPKAIAAWNCRK